MDPKIKNLIEGPFNDAIKFWRNGSVDEAIEILLKIHLSHAPLSTVTGALGAIYREKGDLENAAKYFKITTVLSPLSELASRGLFLSLFRAGRKDEALSEARRFLSLRKSDEYTFILNEINEGLYERPTNFLNISGGLSKN
jgi:tetratricopeptide (TPR) repeat protein